MDQFVAALRAAAEHTRVRLLAVLASGPFCATELADIFGQSQPRLSRHLRLLAEAGLITRQPEGAHVWCQLAPADTAPGSLARALLARMPEDDPMLEGDRRQAARVVAERLRLASESFQRNGQDWDEMRALDLPAAEVEHALLGLLHPAGNLGRVLDLGTGTGRMLELLAPRIESGLGIDASKPMLALARARLARAGLAHCSVRMGDLYRLAMPLGSFDLVLLHMVMHHLAEPRAALIEAARMLRPGGQLVVIDLAWHQNYDVFRTNAHSWAGFPDADMLGYFAAAGLRAGAIEAVPGQLEVRLWSASRVVAEPDAAHRAQVML